MIERIFEVFGNVLSVILFCFGIFASVLSFLVWISVVADRWSHWLNKISWLLLTILAIFLTIVVYVVLLEG